MNTHNNDNVTQLAKRRFVDIWRKYWTLFQRECDLEEQFDTAIMLGRPVQRIKNSLATVSKKRNELDHDMEDLYIEFQFPEHMNELCETEFIKADVEHDLYGAISDLHGDTYQEYHRYYAMVESVKESLTTDDTTVTLYTDTNETHTQETDTMTTQKNQDLAQEIYTVMPVKRICDFINKFSGLGVKLTVRMEPSATVYNVRNEQVSYEGLCNLVSTIADYTDRSQINEWLGYEDDSELV